MSSDGSTSIVDASSGGILFSPPFASGPWIVPGGTFSGLSGLSSDGSVAGGFSNVNGGNSYHPVFVAGSPLKICDMDPAGAYGSSGVYGLDATGTVMVGNTGISTLPPYN